MTQATQEASRAFAATPVTGLDHPFVQPCLPTTDIKAGVTFYRAMGFEVMTHTSLPYDFAEVRYGRFWLHLSRLAPFGGRKAFGASMVTVDDLPLIHDAFADGLRRAFGAVPVRDLPRITRPRSPATSFRTFDPDGNMLVFLNRDAAMQVNSTALTPMAERRAQAEFLRDVYANDAAAAKLLDRIIAEGAGNEACEFARVLAVRAEIATALGDHDIARAHLSWIAGLELRETDRADVAGQVEAVERLRSWIAGEPEDH